MDEYQKEAQNLEKAATRYVHSDAQGEALSNAGDKIFDELQKFLQAHPQGVEQLQQSVDQLRRADPSLPVIDIHDGGLMIRPSSGDYLQPTHVYLKG